MGRMEFDLDLSIDVLRRTPGALRELLLGLAEPWTKGTEINSNSRINFPR